MKPRNFVFLLSGTAFLGFLIGACVQNSAPPGGPLQSTAQAQPIRNVSDLAALGATYAQIAKKVTPAVVNIQSTQVIPGRVLRDPFSEFFGGGDMGGGMFREPDRRAQSLGSGVIVDADGLIITNNHVIRNATSINVTLSDKRRFPAKLLGTDPASDVAVLKIEADKLPVLPYADSDKLQVGDIVLAVGSPFNLASTVTQGIISAKGRRDLGISAYEDFLQTDAAINPGNSGGALADINGNLVGINTAILSESGGNQGIGLAIPANLAHQVAGQLAKSGTVTRGWLGVVVQPLTADVADQIGLAGQGGILVTGIYTRGPAGNVPWSQSGTDVILSAGGQKIDSPGQLRNLVGDAAPGSTLHLRVWQDGKTKDYDVALGKRPERVQGV